MSNPLKSFDAWDPIKHSIPGIAVWVHTPYLHDVDSCRTFKFPNMLRTNLTIHGQKL